MKRKVALLEEERRQLVIELERRVDACTTSPEGADSRDAGRDAEAHSEEPGDGLIPNLPPEDELLVAEDQISPESLPVVRIAASGSTDGSDPSMALGSTSAPGTRPAFAGGSTVPPPAPLLLAGAADAALFDQASEALTRGEHYQADSLLSRFIQDNPRHPFADDALVLRGEARRLSRRPRLAETDFSDALSRYPDEVWAADALLGLGRARHDLGDETGARDAFSRLLSQHPQSVAAMEIPQEYRP